MLEVSFIVAFVAGIVSFVSPCVLPIVPGYLSYLANVSTDPNKEQTPKQKRKAVFGASIFFVLGFSVVFAIVGVILNTLLSAVAYDAQTWFARVGGALVIFFGLYLIGLIKIPWLEKQRSVSIKRKFKSRQITAFIFGGAFAAGWTPCVGAALGAILGLATTNPGQAFPLLMSYALGLGIPFLIIGAFATKAINLTEKYTKQMKIVNTVFGIILIILGILIFTENLARLSSFEFLNTLVL